MAGYYNNPYNYTAYPQMNTPNYSMPMTVSQQPQPQPNMNNCIIWVDGEVGAKAYQLNGQTGPVALWDTNDSVIYVKSVNQLGMPNPLQKIRYQMEEPPAGMLNNGNEGYSGNDQKLQTEIDSLRNDIRELKEAIMQKSMVNQNRAQNNSQRGGNQNA